jgi:hypothetical protein
MESRCGAVSGIKYHGTAWVGRLNGVVLVHRWWFLATGIACDSEFAVVVAAVVVVAVDY